MPTRVRVLRPLSECRVGEFLAVQFEDGVAEGRITFLARTPAGGWFVTLDAESAMYEIYCGPGQCNLVAELMAHRPAPGRSSDSQPVMDTLTGGRLTLARA
jgi:hypothetical protein